MNRLAHLLSAAAGALVLFASTACVAQTGAGAGGATGTGATGATRQHRGLFTRHPTTTTSGTTTAASGPIIGNENTHVYHLAGDKGNMPSAKNRVYFQTEAEAQAAGYHAAKMGGRKASAKTGHVATRTRDPRTGRFLRGGAGK